MITFIETDYYSSQAAPRLAILPGPNSLEQHTCVKLSGTLTGPSEQGGRGAGRQSPHISIEGMSLPSKGLRLQKAFAFKRPSPPKGLRLVLSPKISRPSNGSGRAMDGRTKIVVSRLGTLSPTTGPLKSYIFSIKCYLIHRKVTIKDHGQKTQKMILLLHNGLILSESSFFFQIQGKTIKPNNFLFESD